MRLLIGEIGTERSSKPAHTSSCSDAIEDGEKCIRPRTDQEDPWNRDKGNYSIRLPHSSSSDIQVLGFAHPEEAEGLIRFRIASAREGC